MAQFISSVAETREGIQRPQGDFRFANFGSSPSLPASGPSHKSKQHVKTYFNNKQIFQTICDWFETWMPWQKRIVLCGTTDRCSTTQLEYLATALEPVFHRDFQASLRGTYPALTSKTVMKADLLVEKTKRKKFKNRHVLYPQLQSVNLFAMAFVQKVISDAVKTLEPSDESGSDSLPSNANTEGGANPKVTGVLEQKRKPSPIVEVKEDTSTDDLSIGPQSTTDSSRPASSLKSSSIGSPSRVMRSERTSGSIDGSFVSQQTQHHGLFEIKRKSIDTASLYSQRQKSVTSSSGEPFSKRPSERRKAKNKSQAYNHYFYGQDETVMDDDSRMGETRLEENQLDALPPLEAKKMTTFNWYLSHRVTPSATSTAANSASSSPRRTHRHSKTYPIPGSAASTADFFDKSKIRKLGPMKGLRTGQINKLPNIQDLYITHQKAFKPNKMWTPGMELVSAKKHQLRAVFKDQVEQIWTWLKEWEDHEKGDLLVELLKMCDQELVKFFASCLTKRLEDRLDINSLPDKVLLCVFSWLPPEDLLQAENVCRRWCLLVSSEDVWRSKCTQLGEQHSIHDLVLLVEFYMSEHAVDWKEAYWQLKEVMGRNKSVEDVPKKFNKKRIWRLALERINQLRRKYRHVETESESSSMELDIAVACPRPTSAKTESGSEDRLDSRGSAFTPPSRQRERPMTKPLPTLNTKRKSTKTIEIALDIRPELTRAKNLNPSGEEDEDDEGEIHYDGKIKQIKRVRRFQGHGDTICCIMFDIRRLITGSMDRTIRVWDIRSGKMIRKLIGHKGGIRCLQFDETRIVSGSWDMSVMVWDVVKFELTAELSGHRGVVSCLRFNDRYLVTGSHDKTLRVWSMVDYQCERVIRHHSDAVTCLVLEGDRVISGSMDRTVRICSLPTGECLCTMQHDLQDRVITIICLDDQILVGTLTGRIVAWSKTEGALLAAYQALDSPIYKLALLSQDAMETKILTASADGAISEWVLGSMICVRILQGHRGPVRDIQVSKSRVVSCSEDKTVRIWDLSFPLLKPGDQDDSINTEIVKERDSD